MFTASFNLAYLNSHIFKGFIESYVFISGVRCNTVMRYEHTTKFSPWSTLLIKFRDRNRPTHSEMYNVLRDAREMTRLTTPVKYPCYCRTMHN
jgi:hypothetical protein